MSTVSEVRTYPAGVPCWIDTEQPDPEATCAFYGELFGWQCTNAAGPEAPDLYFIATVGGRDVAAIAPLGDGPAAWNTYVAVDDVRSAAARVSDHGGALVLEPSEVGPGGAAGALAVCADREGARFRLWQARARLGAQLVNRPSAWNFSHLRTRDLTRARGFYEPVFGWQYSEMPGDARMWRQAGYGEHLAASTDPDIYARQAGAPEGFADVVAGAELIDDAADARWKVVFGVADRDESADFAGRLGAEVITLRDTMWTREADLRDPQGAEFTVSQFAPPATAQRPRH